MEIIEKIKKIKRATKGVFLNPYILFAMDERPQIVAQNPTLKQKEIVTKIGQKWKTVSPGAKTVSL